MKIAIDYGGVLENHEWIREMAKSLLKDGHEVYCISAVPETWKGNGKREKQIEKLGIPFTGVHITYHDILKEKDNGQVLVTSDQAFEAGKGKAKVMKEIGCDILIDDMPQIIVAVREEGLTGLHIA